MHLVFHRSFNDSEYFMNPEPISQNVIATLNRETGSLIKAWGKDKFFLPHGISIDQEGNVWVTDIGAHQVMKVQSNQVEIASNLHRIIYYFSLNPDLKMHLWFLEKN